MSSIKANCYDKTLWTLKKEAHVISARKIYYNNYWFFKTKKLIFELKNTSPWHVYLFMLMTVEPADLKYGSIKAAEGPEAPTFI